MADVSSEPNFVAKLKDEVSNAPPDSPMSGSSGAQAESGAAAMDEFAAAEAPSDAPAVSTGEETPLHAAAADSSGGAEGPIEAGEGAALSQSRMVEIFVEQIKAEGAIYYKCPMVHARVATVAGKLTTVVGGDIETTNTVRVGDVIVVNPAGEQVHHVRTLPTWVWPTRDCHRQWHHYCHHSLPSRIA